MSFDSAEANEKFGKKFSFNFPLISDLDRSIGMAYGAADDANASSARRVGVIIGPDGKVKQWYPKVSAAGFPQEALGLI